MEFAKEIVLALIPSAVSAVTTYFLSRRNRSKKLHSADKAKNFMKLLHDNFPCVMVFYGFVTAGLFVYSIMRKFSGDYLPKTAGWVYTVIFFTSVLVSALATIYELKQDEE